MSRSLLALVGVSLSLTSLRADEEAQKVLDRAIAAHGGTSALEQLTRMVRSTTGVMIANQQELACTTQTFFDLPGRVRNEVELTAEKRKLVFVVAGEMGWLVTGGVAQAMSAPALQEAKAFMYTQYVGSLVPLREAKKFTLKSIPGIKVQGKETVGLLVTRKDHDDVRLFFDKSTGLLAQLQIRTAVVGLVQARDFLFGEYKDFSGAKLPTQYLEKINGQKVIEFKTMKYTFPTKVDDRQFGKP